MQNRYTDTPLLFCVKTSYHLLERIHLMILSIFQIKFVYYAKIINKSSDDFILYYLHKKSISNYRQYTIRFFIHIYGLTLDFLYTIL